MMWHISWQKCCLNFSDLFTLPLSDELLTWQKAGGWLSVIWWVESWRSFISQLQGVQELTVSSTMRGTVTPGHQGEDTWTGKGSCVSSCACLACYLLHLLTALGEMSSWSLLNICPQTFNLMYGVYSWPLQCQEISCYSILIEFSFFIYFVANMISWEIQHCCKSFVVCWCMRS